MYICYFEFLNLASQSLEIESDCKKQDVPCQVRYIIRSMVYHRAVVLVAILVEDEAGSLDVILFRPYRHDVDCRRRIV